MWPGAIPGKSLKRKTTENDDKREKTKKYEENRKARTFNVKWLTNREWLDHRHLCRVKYMFGMYLKCHKAGLTPTTPVTSTAIFTVNLSLGRKSLTNLRSEMIFLEGKPVFYIFPPSTPPY
jgi:hypothetical protein